jgi:glutamate--cysteine ligase
MTHNFNLADTLASWHQQGIASILTGMKRGLEKESLRITADGHLAQTPHPRALGAALTHPFITTDFSEALIEFITPAFESYTQPIEFLHRLHRYAYQYMGEERLWVASMPCLLETDAQIPLAQYGSSNLGQLKTLYREGLGHRYGRAMQTIAGIHYNVSFPDALWPLLAGHLSASVASHLSTSTPLRELRDAGYFHVIRNFQRYHWWLVLVMGASPQVCRSFLRAVNRADAVLSADATSLRMGDLGYQNSQQGQLYICHNNLAGFIETLDRAIHTPHPPYQVFNGLHDGKRWQLNDQLLQIENEYYAPIRPKRVLAPGQRPLAALRQAGVEYLEVRCLDLNPYEPVGITSEQMRCVDLFLLMCLLLPSPGLNSDESRINQQNLSAVVNRGRDVQQTLIVNGVENTIERHAQQLAAQMQQVAAWLDGADRADRNGGYARALAPYLQALHPPQQLLSARMVADITKSGGSFYSWAMQQSQRHREQFLASPIPVDALQTCAAWAAQSWQEQQSLEQQQDISFDEYLQQYLLGSESLSGESLEIKTQKT